MEILLSIDASTEPARAVVTRVMGRDIEVLETQVCSLGSTFSWTQKPTEPVADTVTNEAPQSETSDESTVSEQPPSSDTDKTDSTVLKNESPLRSLIQTIKTPWDNSILVIPTPSYLSLNIELPFHDSRSLNRVINLEVQDLVPFQMEEFIAEHHTVCATGDKQYDIHVGLLPKDYMRSVVNSCKEANFDPLIITTPISAAAAIYQIAPEYFARDSVTLLADYPNFSMISCVNGVIKGDRILSPSNDLIGKNSSDFNPSEVITQTKISIMSLERSIGRRFARIYLLGNSLSPHSLQQAIGRDVEKINTAELVKADTTNLNLAALATLYAQDTDAPSIFTNFRVREFSYSPQLKELIVGVKRLLPYIMATILLLLFVTGLTYYTRSLKLSKMRSAIHDQISTIIPSLSVVDGNEVTALQTENASLEKQLQSLGSLSKYSALEALLEITQDVPVSSGISVNRLNISDDKITLDGQAPDYSALEKIERSLKRKSDVYCKIKKEAAAASGGVIGNKRGFTFTIRTCE